MSRKSFIELWIVPNRGPLWSVGFVLTACAMLWIAHGFDDRPGPSSAALRMDAWLGNGGSFDSTAIIHISARTQDIADPRRTQAPRWLIDRRASPKLHLFRPVAAAGASVEIAPASAQLLLVRSADGYERSVNCLAAAVHYEAATEPRAGQEAVAQVVLNRVRSPGFPKSVCGVVFQGSDLPTGCQFTFTCDGSLHRRPSAAAWRLARGVAESALSGHLATAIGDATNYHAFYVRPYWAGTLTRIAQIGAHIFYRRPGAGEPRGFVGDPVARTEDDRRLTMAQNHWGDPANVAASSSGRNERRGAFSFRLVTLAPSAAGPVEAGRPIFLGGF